MPKKDKKRKDAEQDSEIIAESAASEKADAPEVIDTPGEADELAKAKAQNDEYLDKLRRTMAEFDNYRSRTMREKSSLRDDTTRETIEKLLPVLDNFERALASAQNKEDGFVKGVDMILRQFQMILLDMGVETIPAAGEKFDPNLHNAVAHTEDETKPENTITDELQRGYTYKGKVIRHSAVRVAN